MPTVSVDSNIPIYVDFPEEFDEAMFLGWTPICSFENVGINDADIITNFVNSSSLINIRRIKINMFSDSNNIANCILY